MKKEEKSKIKLEISVSFESVPSDDELEEILSFICQTGSIEKATLEIVTPYKRDLHDTLHY